MLMSAVWCSALLATQATHEQRHRDVRPRAPPPRDPVPAAVVVVVGPGLRPVPAERRAGVPRARGARVRRCRRAAVAGVKFGYSRGPRLGCSRRSCRTASTGGRRRRRRRRRLLDGCSGVPRADQGVHRPTLGREVKEAGSTWKIGVGGPTSSSSSHSRGLPATLGRRDPQRRRHLASPTWRSPSTAVASSQISSKPKYLPRGSVRRRADMTTRRRAPAVAEEECVFAAGSCLMLPIGASEACGLPWRRRVSECIKNM